MIPRRESGEAEMIGLSADATAVLQFLRQRGASFFADIVPRSCKLKSEVEAALLGTRRRRPSHGGCFDNLRRADRSQAALRAGELAVLASRRQFRPLVATLFGETGDTIGALEAHAGCFCAVTELFSRAAHREPILPKWREIAHHFSRSEDRGAIRGAASSAGLGRAVRPKEWLSSRCAPCATSRPTGELINRFRSGSVKFVGIVVPGERVPVNPAEWLLSAEA